jgi:hypothetical protein
MDGGVRHAGLEAGNHLRDREFLVVAGDHTKTR